MERSEQINELAEALAAAQRMMTGARKDASNPHLNRNYADLASVWDACREPLSCNGLSVSQLPVDAPQGSLGVKTLLMHKSGQFLAATIFMPCAGTSGVNQAQAYGSAMTYARRYSLSAIVGIAPDDDDGATAAPPANQKRPTPSAPARPTQPAATAAGNPTPLEILKAAEAQFRDLAAAGGYTKAQQDAAIAKCVTGKSMVDRTAQFSKLIDAAQKKARQAAGSPAEGPYDGALKAYNAAMMSLNYSLEDAERLRTVHVGDGDAVALQQLLDAIVDGSLDPAKELNAIEGFTDPFPPGDPGSPAVEEAKG